MQSNHDDRDFTSEHDSDDEFNCDDASVSDEASASDEAQTSETECPADEDVSNLLDEMDSKNLAIYKAEAKLEELTEDWFVLWDRVLRLLRLVASEQLSPDLPQKLSSRIAPKAITPIRGTMPAAPIHAPFTLEIAFEINGNATVMVDGGESFELTRKLALLLMLLAATEPMTWRTSAEISDFIGGSRAGQSSGHVNNLVFRLGAELKKYKISADLILLNSKKARRFRMHPGSWPLIYSRWSPGAHEHMVEHRDAV